jgi:Ca-activated chloride channel family protein
MTTHFRLLAALAALVALAGVPLASGAGGTTIQAPGTVDPGQAVTVTVEDGRADGRIEVWGPDTGRGPAQRISGQAAGGGASAVTAPVEPGTYELRYLDGAGKVLARTDLDVATVPVSLSAPEALGAGYDATVLWRGPGGPGDMIQIHDPASGRVLAEAPAIGGAGALNSAVLRMPEVFGTFELRYWQGSRQVVLRTLPITVGEGIGWLRSPTEVVVGTPFSVEWAGPTGPDDVYQLVDPATGTVLSSAPALDASGAAGPVRMTAPARPGAYRVRYVNTASGYVVADLPLDVDPQ